MGGYENYELIMIQSQTVFDSYMCLLVYYYYVISTC
jgi:hypothetical protein